MISSRADFFFFSALVSELVSFLLVEDDAAAAALRALAPRTELDLEGPAMEQEAPRLNATAGKKCKG